MARVSARRAAGWTANAFLEKQGIQLGAKSSFQCLIYLKDSPLLSAESKASLEKLTSALEKDDAEGESYWPPDTDLIGEARKLARALLPNYSI